MTTTFEIINAADNHSFGSTGDRRFAIELATAYVDGDPVAENIVKAMVEEYPTLKKYGPIKSIMTFVGFYGYAVAFGQTDDFFSPDLIEAVNAFAAAKDLELV